MNVSCVILHVVQFWLYCSVVKIFCHEVLDYFVTFFPLYNENLDFDTKKKSYYPTSRYPIIPTIHQDLSECNNY